ncbi:inositol hexakisphosphate kinase 3 [Daphnia magna]|uniref:Uncharacterized protein n=2 Tax=Daphnia magna TaxID=35525 RepID=A0ABR0ABG0_9CRUS|nr:inositol hexakisphosphate kinase 3 [Daphnia magna]KAK4022424.1 hypothetical protein OUZ56_007891 [Daphnia magna]KZS09482.1 Inositol hexakisphosphate kinase 2 [Daphnia magna]
MDSPSPNEEPKLPPQVSLKLEPFVHQVGGHSSMLCLDEATVGKPLLVREKAFYENLPEILVPFTAQYRGTIQVTCNEDAGGYLTLTTFPPAGYIAYEGTMPVKHRIKWHHGICIDIECVETSSDEDIFEDDTSMTPVSSSPCVEHSIERRPSHSHNPWILHCHRGHIAKMLGLDVDAIHSQQSHSPCHFENLPSFEFLLLENLTWRRKRPCVLDVKMGTRQYGDDAPESKRRSQSLKVENSTSGSLGIRLCGMQVFQVSTNKYLCRNKYYGRSLTDDGLRCSLAQFFHNGERLRTDIFLLLLDRLNRLLAVISQLDSYRLFTSSLLIIYDGLDGQPSEIDVRIIDFAHATQRDMTAESQTYTGPDDGFIFGLKSLIELIEELSKKE